jgi:GT2 family glycosyltransferase
VIVVNHGPGDELTSALSDMHLSLKVLSPPANPGFGSGCNFGAEKVMVEGVKGIWFLNKRCGH